MSFKSTMMFYPVESYNNRQRAEQRWNDDVRTNLNDDGWQISIKNGKRLNRHWNKAQGFYIVNTSYGERTIYNEHYDADLNRAKYDRSFQPDVEAGCYDLSGGYDSIPYHVGMDY